MTACHAHECCHSCDEICKGSLAAMSLLTLSRTTVFRERLGLHFQPLERLRMAICALYVGDVGLGGTY